MGTKADQIKEFFMGPLKAIDMKGLIDWAVNRHSAYALELNKRQLKVGQLDTGKAINPPYTQVTVAIKKAKGQPYDRVTLKDTGDFQDSMYMKRVRGGNEITAFDWKTLSLSRKYSVDIFGLNDRNKGILCNRMKPDAQKQFKSLLRHL
ncbi:hypothetical protein BWI93_00995 [Siphonobacter sp. BAB-5385]|uniref:hypothetical protein n=1 Tax=Siphonobacter sp. BAB-5385 TaxID=1864822 RepID=UPI000B9E506D|nr:hypothetical protein [Siphonobacter sp. BAB-5385]OZI09947.1 hypothetical protein BWI93_00995 [Siphonobacter sp. BAB-5385]